MSANRAWTAYPATYREREIEAIAPWILTNTSGSVVGLPGIGKSNLLGFLCHRPDVLQRVTPRLEERVILVPVDLNNLPSTDLATFYRTILRAFYEFSRQVDTVLQEAIGSLYQDVKGSRDPFLSQSALRQLLQQAQEQGLRVVLVLDRFDTFCQMATERMTDTLRGLRDSYKETLAYIVAMTQEVIYLPEPGILGELRELLDMNVCWVGLLNDADSRHLIATVTNPASIAPTETEVRLLQQLSGNHPALLKAACQWWLLNPGRPRDEWKEALLDERSVRSRLARLWAALSQEEQRVLARLQLQRRAGESGTKNGIPQNPEGAALQTLDEEGKQVLDGLVVKGVGRWVNLRGEGDHWAFASQLLAAYVSLVGGRSRGKLWYDDEKRVFYQGRERLEELTPLEGSLLEFLLARPRTRHTYTELIEATWPEEVHIEGVSTEALYQLVRGLRRKVEVTPSRPQYIVNWRGRPEGGYLCYPEGRPR